MLKLRELKREDVIVINQWRSNEELIADLGAPFRFINPDVDYKWFDSYMLSRNNTVRCAIVDDSNDEIMGLISLVKIDYFNQSAELHIMIGEERNQGRGIGSFAVTKILQHAFNDLNLHRIELSVLESNVRAQHLYEKVGFVQEGKKRESNYKNGSFQNMLVYSILKTDSIKTLEE